VAARRPSVASGGRSDQFACARLNIRGRGVVSGNRAEAISLAEVQRADLCLASAHRTRQHGLEHRLKLAGRAGDDTEHLRSRRRLLQRLAQIVGALAQLVEQAGVLDCNHRLIGEG
jgi:hypothetical protein